MNGRTDDAAGRLASAATGADVFTVSHVDGNAQASSSPLANRRLRIAIAAWTLAGVLGGVLASTEPWPGGGAASGLAQLAGFVTGAAIGLTGLTAISAGLLAYAIVAELMQILGVGAYVMPLWDGTFVALSASLWLLLGAGARYLVRRRRASNGVAEEPAIDAGAAQLVGAPDGSRIRVWTAGRWTGYWLLAVGICPVINLSLGFRMLSSLGGGPSLLLFPLLIVGESVALRRLVRNEAPGPSRLGLLTTAGLVFAVTIVWTFVLFLIILSRRNAFTF